MSTLQADFLERLRATFRVEAQEHLQAIAAGLVALEQARQPELQKPIVDTVFRAAHSLKGAARAVEYRDVESACQALEDTFAAWKRQESAPQREVLDALHARLDLVGRLLNPASAPPVPPASAARPPPPPSPASAARSAPAEGPPPLANEPASASAAAPAQPPGPVRGDTVRVGVDVLDARLLEAEEMLAVKLATRRWVDDLRELGQRVHAWRAESADPPAQQQRLKAMQDRLADLTRAAEQERAAVAKLVDDLLANSKKLLLLPFDTIAAPLPKVVRDLCRTLGKEAELRIDGGRIELDKRILDTLKDPLIHLLRNSVDHGIELPAERVARGKPERAEIRLDVDQLPGGQVQITLSDDGAGIDAAKVRAAAVNQGVLAAEAAAQLTDAQAQALVFRADVSTSPIITELSGRGLGLAIVEESTAKLGGQVSVESRRGVGTTFRLVVPAMRATFRGILVQAAGALLVLPTAQVERVLRATAQALRAIEGRANIEVGGRVLPLVTLAQVLELEDPRGHGAVATGAPVVVLGADDRGVAFAVDEVLDEQEFLVKPLAPPLSRVRNVASAAVLPSGRVALILNVADLLQSARGRGAPLSPRAAGEEPAAPAEAAAILVAEDSITSRMLIKSTLESAGYRVTTAVDGIDALGRLRSAEFDLVVSDVEMPRLNGFDLTASIRADRRMAELPVVLVTALESREDRERGVDAGANAYIVKSSFDQSTLLDAVRRLI